MPKRERNNRLRYMGLGAYTALGAWATVQVASAVTGLDDTTLVDALEEPPPGGGEWPLVSIIVPARNEERNLPRLLPSLLEQRYPNYEVIVVDDQSEDSTLQILQSWAERDKRLRVVSGKPLPREEGWLGKPHAMHQGAEQAKGEWLLFTDADSFHEQQALPTTMHYALANNSDLLTIFPHYELVTPSERLVMPVVFMGILTLYPPRKVLDPKSKVAIANGQYILIKRDVYTAVGGVSSVKGQIVEDLEFGKVVKQAGYRLCIINGRQLMKVRMYTNLREIWEGWSKNIVLSFRTNPFSGFLTVFGLFALAFMPGILVRRTTRAWQRAGISGRKDDRLFAGWQALITTWILGNQLFYRRKVDTMLGLPIGWTFTQPVGALLLAAIVASSAVNIARGRGVTWKGRTYAGRG